MHCNLVSVVGLILILSTLSVGTSSSFGEPLNLAVQKILPPDPAGSNLWFGNDVDINGDHLIISGPTSGNRGGKAYLYELSDGSWQHAASMSGPINDSGFFFFGRNATISEEESLAPTRILVSSDGGGRVFEESSGSWIETALLPGYGAIDGNTAVSIVAGPEAVVSRFNGSAWTGGETLTPTFADGFGLDGGFGDTVVFDGNRLLISAPSQDASGALINSGVVFAYERTGGVWSSAGAIVPSDPVFRGSFGYDIDAHNGTLLVGRPGGSPTSTPNQGIAYVYEQVLGNWVETARLQASQGFLEDGFGSQVALSENYAAVMGRTDTGDGRVYLYRRGNDSWNEMGWFETGLPFTADQFGVSLALDGNKIVIGARLDDALGTNAGAVYIYTIPEPGTLLTCVFALCGFQFRRQRLV